MGRGIPEQSRLNPAYNNETKVEQVVTTICDGVAKTPEARPAGQPAMPAARVLGRQAAALGLETLDLARIHEQALAALEASSSRDGIIKRAEIFFAEAITPIEETHRAALKANVRLNQLHQTLGRRTADLAASNRSLKQGIVQRKTVEQALKKSGEHSPQAFEGVPSPAETFAASDPPDSVGAGGQTKEDQPRPA